MASGTLYSYSGSLRAAKIQIAAEYSGSQLTQGQFEFGKTNTSAEFLKKFPLGKVPAFESKEGQCLYETDAIAQFVSNQQLRGKTPIDQALVQQYVAFSNNEITPSACTWTFPCLGFKQYNKADTSAAQEHLKKIFAMLNDTLLTKTFLVGERVTLADISLCCDLVCLYKLVLDPKFRAPYGNLNRWFMTCINQPQFKKVLGEVKLAETMAQFDNKKYQELHPKPAKGGDNKKQDNKKQEKKKEDKPAAAPAEPEKKPEKKKNVFADLPPTPFILDEWKKYYSNNEIEVSMPWLWEKLDKEGWSFWHSDYQYNSDFALDFQCSNLMTGLEGRIDGLRKHAMGVLLGFGPHDEAPKFRLEAVWMFRGQKLAFELDENWNVDAPSFTHRKLDPWNNAEEKQMIYNFWRGDDWEDGTRKVFQYHCFK
jgi:elongation factor 1-gamma